MSDKSENEELFANPCPKPPPPAVPNAPPPQPQPAVGRPVEKEEEDWDLFCGWFLFGSGFLLGIPWLVGALILLCNSKTMDPQAKPGYQACALAVVLGIIVIIIGSLVGPGE